MKEEGSQVHGYLVRSATADPEAPREPTATEAWHTADRLQSTKPGGEGGARDLCDEIW